MKISRTMAGVVAASLLSVSLVAPAEARGWRGYHRGHANAGDVLAVAAVIGGAAAIIGAAQRDQRRRAEQAYDRGYAADDGDDGRYDARDDYAQRDGGGTSVAVDSCGNEATHYGAGEVRVTGVEQGGDDLFWVQGVVEDGGRYAADDQGDDGHDRYYDRARGEYPQRYYDRDAQDGGITFTCEARGNGRITDFAFNRY